MNRHLLTFVLAAAFAAPVLAEAPVVEPRIHAPGPFDAITVTGAGQVRLFQGDRDEIVVPGERRLIDSVGVHLAGTTLAISLPRDPKLLGNLAQVEVHVRHLTRLTLVDASSVSAPLTFRTDRLALRVAGSGMVAFDKLEVGPLTVDIGDTVDARLVGNVDKLQLTASGKSHVAADHLRVRSVEATVSGTASAELWAVNELDVRIADSGHVRYWGRPSLQTTITGQGSIDARGTR